MGKILFGQEYFHFENRKHNFFYFKNTFSNYFISVFSKLFDNFLFNNKNSIHKLVPGTTAISRRRQSINPQVAVKSICDRPAADYDS
jgi:hypothetical protein